MSDGDIEIRAAADADIDRVLDLWGRARAPHARTPDTPEAVAVLRDRDQGALLVAVRDGEIVGTLIAAFDGWRGSMYRLAVDADHRRKGIAGALLDAGERRLLELGARRISALVGADDEVATATWHATGYERDEVIARFVKNV